MEIKWSADAKQTWLNSLEYCVDNYGIHFGLKLSNILTKKINTISSFPESGSPMPPLDTETYKYRSILLYKDYKIIYRIDYQNNIIIIIDIVNMRFDYEDFIKRVSGK